MVRKDDTSVDISWYHAIKPEGKPTTKEDVDHAARFEIYKQTEEFREINKINIETCELCQLPINKDEEIHVDHIIFNCLKPYYAIF